MKTTLMTFSGLSMAPWLLKGDVLVVQTDVTMNEIAEGDVLVFHSDVHQQTIAHRLIDKEKHIIKGDRLSNIDEWDASHVLLGKALGRFRHHQYLPFKFKKTLAFISRFGLYPESQPWIKAIIKKFRTLHFFVKKVLT